MLLLSYTVDTHPVLYMADTHPVYTSLFNTKNLQM